MSDETTKVTIHDFTRFPKKMRFGVVGTVLGEVSNGMTSNFFSGVVFQPQLTGDVIPTVSVANALSSISYSIAPEIIVALRFLQEKGWFDKSVRFSTKTTGACEVVVLDWGNTPGEASFIELAFYLEDVCQELESASREYSPEWFYAKISHLYCEDRDNPDIIFTIGILLSQLWMKEKHENAALRGAENEASLLRANKVRKAQSPALTKAKNMAIVELWNKAFDQFGADTMRHDSNAAQAIYELAFSLRPKELLVKSTGDVIGTEAIRKRIISLRKTGELG